MPTLKVRLEIPVWATPVIFHVVMGLTQTPTRMELLPPLQAAHMSHGHLLQVLLWSDKEVA